MFESSAAETEFQTGLLIGNRCKRNVANRSRFRRE